MKIRIILEDLIAKKNEQIQQWFESYYQKIPPVIYSSVDIRNAGYKIAPVDTNIFPAGFNNLDQKSSEFASFQFKQYVERYLSNINKILIITEKNTRNLYYLDNLANITKIINDAGYKTYLANFDIVNNLELISASGKSITLNKIDNLDDFDLILLNNDLTKGVPEELKNYRKTILPNLNLGWYKRRKSDVFYQYNLVAKRFCEDFSLDPFFITTIFKNYKMVNFKDTSSRTEIASGVEEIITILKKKYQDYKIQASPYVFIKSNMGTYGMGIINANSGDDILKMNKIAKNKMAAIKNGVINDEIIIQEGLRTVLKCQNFPSEKMIYCVRGKKIAEINRFNEVKDAYSNLNSSKGMKFKINSTYKYNPYSLIAELASLAVCFEKQ